MTTNPANLIGVTPCVGSTMARPTTRISQARTTQSAPDSDNVTLSIPSLGIDFAYFDVPWRR